jgi:hypothetical protein
MEISCPRKWRLENSQSTKMEIPAVVECQGYYRWASLNRIGAWDFRGNKFVYAQWSAFWMSVLPT